MNAKSTPPAPADFGGLSFAEMAVLARTTKGGVQALHQKGYLPQGSENRAAKRAALIGGLADAGLAAIAAGAVAECLAARSNSYDGEAHCGLQSLARAVNPKLPLPAWLKSDEERTDLWIHRRMRQFWPEYLSGKALVGDMIFEIIDRRALFVAALGKNGTFHSPGGDHDGFDYIGRIEWTRGGEARVEEALAEASPTWIAEARRHATAKVTINVGLAIRNGLDRLYDRQTGSKR